MRGLGTITIASLLPVTSANAGVWSADQIDYAASFLVKSRLQYLFTSGFSEVRVVVKGSRTDVMLGANDIRSDFSDVVWNVAQRVSLQVNNQVLLSVYEAGITNFGQQICWLRARKGQVFDGTC